MSAAWSRVRPEIRQRLRLATLAAWGNRCHLCQKEIDVRLRYPHPGSYTVDHVVPVNRGGALLDAANLRPAHLGCNAAKQDRPVTVVEAPFRPRVQW